MTADSGEGHSASGGVNSPSKKKSLPWAQVVTGEADAVNYVATPSSPPLTASDNAPPPPPLPVVEAAEGKPKPATWKSPTLSNGAADPVMGAVSWPALSESTKPSPKSPAAAASDSVTQATPDGSELHATPHSRSGPSNSNSGQNRMAPSRQRSIKKGGNNFGGGSSAGGHLQNNPPSPPPPPPYPVLHMHPNMVHAIPDHSPRAPPYRGNNWEPRAGFVPQLQPLAVNDQRHSSRRGNFGPRGESPRQNNLGGKDRAHYGGTRDNSMQRGSPRGYVRPPPPSAANYVQPQPMRPFNPIAYSDFVYVPALQMEPYGGVQFMAPPIPPHFITPIPAMLVQQIEYYFSDANLVKDEYLKSNMDSQGWVPITLIAGFYRVKRMTNNIQVILESLRTSTVVEIQDDKVRRRNDWMKWIPSSSRLQTDSSPSSSSLSPGLDTSTNSTQTISQENAAANQNAVAAKPSSFPSDDPPVSRSSETDSQQGDAEGASSS